MTAKEKAEELIYNFKTPLDIIVPNYAIKRNAVICVDEILKLPFEHEEDRKYWQEVKKQIKNL